MQLFLSLLRRKKFWIFKFPVRAPNGLSNAHLRSKAMEFGGPGCGGHICSQGFSPEPAYADAPDSVKAGASKGLI